MRKIVAEGNPKGIKKKVLINYVKIGEIERYLS